MIRSFRTKETQRIFRRERVRGLSLKLQTTIQRKLVILDAAESLEDLWQPPGNRLEKLTGKRKGQYSIRVNDQWRICFTWRDGAAFAVEVTDYH